MSVCQKYDMAMKMAQICPPQGPPPPVAHEYQASPVNLLGDP